MRTKVTTLVLLLCLVGTCDSLATTLSSDNMLILAGGNFSAESKVTIKGNIGAVGTVSMAMHSTISGDAYSQGNFSIDQKATVGGRIVSSGDVWVGKHSVLGGIDGWGNVRIGQQTTVNGDVLSGKVATIDKMSVIHGDVEYGTSYQPGMKVTVDGSVRNDTSDLDVWSAKLNKAPTAWTSSTNSISYDSGMDQILAPGTYGDVAIKDGSILRLAAGTYNISSMWLGNSAQLLADTRSGNVVINVVKGLSTGSSAVLDSGDVNSLIINSNSSIDLGTGTVSEANLSSFGGSISVADDSTVHGRLFATGDVCLGSGVLVDGATAVSSSSTVPEPGTALILLVGGALAMRRRAKYAA